MNSIIKDFPSIRKKISFAFTVICFLIIMVLCLNPLISSLFNSQNTQSFNVIDCGVGIMFALSSLCFSWARNIQPDEKLFKELNSYGVGSLHAAILFLIGSTFKFTLIYQDDNIFNMPTFITYFLLFLELCAFSIATAKSALVIGNITHTIIENKNRGTF